MIFKSSKPSIEENKLAELDQLKAAQSGAFDPAHARHLRDLRHEIGDQLVVAQSSTPSYAEPDPRAIDESALIPTLAPEAMTAGAIRAAILARGCVLIRGLVPTDRTTRLVEGIDAAVAARKAAANGDPAPDGVYEEFEVELG